MVLSDLTASEEWMVGKGGKVRRWQKGVEGKLGFVCKMKRNFLNKIIFKKEVVLPAFCSLHKQLQCVT